MLLGTLGASLLRNLLTSKGAIARIQRIVTFRAAEGTIKSGQDF